MVEKPKQQLAVLRRGRFVASSESLAQLELLLEAVETGPAAAIDSLIETAKLDGVNPWTWLTPVLTQIADHPINRIDELLAWKLKPAN